MVQTFCFFSQLSYQKLRFRILECQAFKKVQEFVEYNQSFYAQLCSLSYPCLWWQLLSFSSWVGLTNQSWCLVLSVEKYSSCLMWHVNWPFSNCCFQNNSGRYSLIGTFSPSKYESFLLLQYFHCSLVLLSRSHTFNC